MEVGCNLVDGWTTPDFWLVNPSSKRKWAARSWLALKFIIVYCKCPLKTRTNYIIQYRDIQGIDRLDDISFLLRSNSFSTMPSSHQLHGSILYPKKAAGIVRGSIRNFLPPKEKLRWTYFDPFGVMILEHIMKKLLQALRLNLASSVHAWPVGCSVEVLLRVRWWDQCFRG